MAIDTQCGLILWGKDWLLQKKLLKENGVIFISIDDNEQAPLKMLCDGIFGQENFIEQIIWKKRATPPNDRVIGRNHEYILCYGKSENYELNLLPRSKSTLSRYSNPDNDINGSWSMSDLSANGKGGRLSKTCVFGIKNKNNGLMYYPPKDKCWLYNQEKINNFLKEGRISFRKSGTPFLKRYLSEVRQGQTSPTIWLDAGFSQDSATEIKNLFNGENIFENPKPTTLIKRLLSVGSKNKNAVILDFMAGSGTTGHAVLDLNKDGGNRKFILCTNNENKICEEVTYPRIQKVINGYKNFKRETVNGLGGNLKYFKTDFIKNTNNRDQLKINLTKKCTEILCVKENIFNLKKDKGNYKIFASNDKSRHLCIYYNFIDKDFDSFIKDISKLDGKKAVYIFALNNKIDKKKFSGIKDISFEAIPYKILEVYEQLVKISKK